VFLIERKDPPKSVLLFARRKRLRKQVEKTWREREGKKQAEKGRKK
jgi:hypothetical protein